MDLKILNQFRELLIKNKTPVSKLEYTKDNYDDNGKLIYDGIPTITTDVCEIGLYNNEIYFVFVIESKTFNYKLFKAIKDKSNIQIYGFKDFNRTLYPNAIFNYDNFIKLVLKDKYLQIQFDFKSMNAIDLFNEYTNLTNIFTKFKVVVIDQIKVNLTNS